MSWLCMLNCSKNDFFTIYRPDYYVCSSEAETESNCMGSQSRNIVTQVLYIGLIHSLPAVSLLDCMADDAGVHCFCFECFVQSLYVRIPILQIFVADSGGVFFSVCGQCVCVSVCVCV